MKFAVTYVLVSRHSRRRMGKSQVETIDTATSKFYTGLTEPHEVEEVFQRTNLNNTSEVKVVDVRVVEEVSNA